MSTSLAKFMKKLNGLPSSVKSSYSEIAELDQKCLERRKKLARICFNLLNQQQQPSNKKGGAAKKDAQQKRYAEALVSWGSWF
jgi:hypothetical protein